MTIRVLTGDVFDCLAELSMARERIRADAPLLAEVV